MPSSTRAIYSLTTSNASSSHYTLTVMTIVALIFTPIVLGYQAWTYWCSASGSPSTTSRTQSSRRSRPWRRGSRASAGRGDGPTDPRVRSAADAGAPPSSGGARRRPGELPAAHHPGLGGHRGWSWPPWTTARGRHLGCRRGGGLRRSRPRRLVSDAAAACAAAVVGTRRTTTGRARHPPATVVRAGRRPSPPGLRPGERRRPSPTIRYFPALRWPGCCPS